jgi:hypothetical protein
VARSEALGATADGKKEGVGELTTELMREVTEHPGRTEEASRLESIGHGQATNSVAIVLQQFQPETNQPLYLSSLFTAQVLLLRLGRPAAGKPGPAHHVATGMDDPDCTQVRRNQTDSRVPARNLHRPA